jgi:hypothetical protein
MSIYDSLGGQPDLAQLKAHPAEQLKKAGYTIPAGMTDAQAIINHLMQTGQVTSPRLQMAQRIMNMFRR